MIVDDEVLIRKRIRLGINWSKYGMTVQGEAANAGEAMRFIKLHHPDIAIIDIAMPGTSGLDLVRKIKAGKHNLKIILLTGHSRFEYAQQALQDGVFSYILKPVYEAEMEEALKKLRYLLDHESKREVLVRGLQENQARADIDRFLSSAIYRWDDSQLPETLPNALSDTYWLALLNMEKNINPKPWLDRFGPADFSYIFVNPTDPSILVLLIGGKDQIEEDDCICFLQEIYKEISYSSRVNGHIALSRRFTKPQNLDNAYEQALMVLRNRLLLSPPFITYSQLEPLQDSRFIFSGSLQREIFAALRAGDIAGSESCIRSLFQELQQEKMPYLAWRHAIRVYITLLEEAAMALDFPSLLRNSIDTDEIFSNAKSIDWIICQLMQPVHLLADSLNKKPCQLLTRQVCQYVKTNYYDQMLSLSTIADWLKLSPAYISRTFKKDMGISLVSYITDVRMQMAKDFLNDGVKIYQAASQAGYSDEYYFSRSFKKHFGMSPSEYVRNRPLSATDSVQHHKNLLKKKK